MSFWLWVTVVFNRQVSVCSRRSGGFYGFGSNGGGELLAFDSSSLVFTIPFIAMAAGEAKLVADSWTEFVEMMEK